VAAWRYRAYGVGLDSAGSASVGLKRFRWAGAQYDAETGFYFLRTRYYDPAVGRFVQEDKVGPAGGADRRPSMPLEKSHDFLQVGGEG
jgi:RHS repeat-associated protein